MLSKATHGRHILQSPAQQYLFSVENKIVSCASRAARHALQSPPPALEWTGKLEWPIAPPTISIPNTPKITTASKAPRSLRKTAGTDEKATKTTGPSPAPRRISSKRKAESALSSSKKSITATAASSTGKKARVVFSDADAGTFLSPSKRGRTKRPFSVKSPNLISRSGSKRKGKSVRKSSASSPYISKAKENVTAS